MKNANVGRLVRREPFYGKRSVRWAGLVLFLTMLLGADPLHGQASAPGSPPEMLAYQGYLVDANGQALGMDSMGNPNPANYDVVFRVYDRATGGAPLWAEQQTITVDAGYFSVLLGEGAVYGSEPRPNLSTLFRGLTGTERFVGISVRFEDGGEFVEILPRLRLLSSPYAFLATSANQLVTPEGAALVVVDGSHVTVSGILAAQSISGAGASITNINAANVTTGVLHTARIPNLPASIINSGAFHADRIPNISAAKITTGTLGDARLTTNIPKLNAAQTFTRLNIFSGGLRLNDSDVFLRPGNDGNHGLGWYGTGRLFAGINVDGPVLYGNAGGALGVNRGGARSIALEWNQNNQVIVRNGPLSVQNNIHVNSRLYNNGIVGWGGTLRDIRQDPNDSQYHYPTSSRRYKEEIEPLATDFSRILEVVPVTYLPKIPEGKAVPEVRERSMGYIAEEIHDLGMTWLVNYDDLGRPDSLNYELFSIYLTEAVKEQQAEIIELRQSLAELQEAVAALLEARVNGN